jgi:hypothetical protein
MGARCDVCEVDIWGNWCFSELCLEYTSTRRFVGQRDVDEGIETTRSAKSIVELLRSVGGADDENVLL